MKINPTKNGGGGSSFVGISVSIRDLKGQDFLGRFRYRHVFSLNLVLKD